MLVYGFAVAVAFLAWHFQPGALTRSLLAAWALSAVAGAFLPHQWMPGAFAIVDMMVAVVSLSLWTEYRCQRARLTGGISMLLICAHFGYSASQGVGNWTLYASILNAGFALQCFTAGGGWDGLVRFYDRFRHRHNHLHVSLHKKRP